MQFDTMCNQGSLHCVTISKEVLGLRNVEDLCVREFQIVEREIHFENLQSECSSTKICSHTVIQSFPFVLYRS